MLPRRSHGIGLVVGLATDTPRRRRGGRVLRHLFGSPPLHAASGVTAWRILSVPASGHFFCHTTDAKSVPLRAVFCNGKLPSVVLRTIAKNPPTQHKSRVGVQPKKMIWGLQNGCGVGVVLGFRVVRPRLRGSRCRREGSVSSGSGSGVRVVGVMGSLFTFLIEEDGKPIHVCGRYALPEIFDKVYALGSFVSVPDSWRYVVFAPDGKRIFESVKK